MSLTNGKEHSALRYARSLLLNASEQLSLRYEYWLHASVEPMNVLSLLMWDANSFASMRIPADGKHPDGHLPLGGLRLPDYANAGWRC